MLLTSLISFIQHYYQYFSDFLVHNLLHAALNFQILYILINNTKVSKEYILFFDLNWKKNLKIKIFLHKRELDYMIFL